MLVEFQVFGQGVDPGGQQCHLCFGGTGVGLVETILG